MVAACYKKINVLQVYDVLLSYKTKNQGFVLLHWFENL